MQDYQTNEDTDQDMCYKFIYPSRGVVVNDEDPRDVGRVKIRVKGVYPEEIPDIDLPWAIPALGLYRSGGDNSKTSRSDKKALDGGFNSTGTGGLFTVPRVGNHVWVFFDRGNHMYPVYFAMSPGDSDWLTNKLTVKDRIDNKIQQIHKFKSKFSPVDGSDGTDGLDWADGAHVNTRSDTTSEGEKTPYKNGGGADKVTVKTTSEITGGEYPTQKLHISNNDAHGDSSKNADDVVDRSFGNDINLDIKPLFDKEPNNGKIDRSKEPHKLDPDGKIDDEGDKLRNVNRYITSFTSVGGTSIIIDNREGQENFYIIHKNYIFNADENGSVKEYCGRNNDVANIRGETTERGNNDPKSDVRANKELGVEGNYKIHVLGNFVTYTKGNAFMQVDKNMQIDVNDSYGIRVRKGDVDIIIEGEEKDNKRDFNSKTEEAKTKQRGDLNIAVKNGHMELFVKENANIHVGDQCNLKVDGDMKVHVGKSYHLHVEGDYNEFIEGNKYSTIKKDNENRIEGERKTEVSGSCATTIGATQSVTVGSEIKIKGTSLSLDCPTGLNVNSTTSNFSGSVNVVNNVTTGANVFSSVTNLNYFAGHRHPGVKSGPSSTFPPPPTVFGAVKPPVVSIPDPGDNDGAGVSPDASDDVKKIDGPASSKTSPNKTKKAKRRNVRRKAKPTLKSSVPSRSKQVD